MPAQSRTQLAVAGGVLVVGLLLAIGAVQIRSEAGYSGVGPNFLPWVVAAALTACGAMLGWEVWRGGFRDMEAPSGAERGDWRGFAWISAGILANAALITTIGFIASCTLCFALAAHGFKTAEGAPSRGFKGALVNIGIGFAIAAPVYWMFTQLLAINLPGLTSTGWL